MGRLEAKFSLSPCLPLSLSLPLRLRRQISVIRPGTPDAAMPAVIGSFEVLLDAAIGGVHHGQWSEVNLAVRVGHERLSEMALAQPVARFVQRHCFNVNIPVDSPDEAVVVEDLAESDVGHAVVVNIGRSACCRVNENEREGDADD